MKPIIVQSISGGMDSTALALYHLAAGSELHLISIDYGQKHRLELARLDSLRSYLSSNGLEVAHARLGVPFGALADSALTHSAIPAPKGHFAEEAMRQTVVPNRNAIFAAIGFAQALSLANERKQPAALSLGVHSGDHDIYPDCREPFFTALHAAFVMGNWNGEAVSLDLPFLQLDKAGILRSALASCHILGLDFDEVMSRTSTSYAPTPEGLADGYTGSDVERVLAFHEIGRVDPVVYKHGWEATLANALRVKEQWEAENLPI